MSAAEQVGTNTPEPMALVCAIRRMNKAGFELRVTAGRLQAAPADNLTDTQRAYLREHKPALVQLFTDAEHLAELLAQAGTEGLGWREGTPADWTDAYLLAVGELLYATGRMVNRAERRYLAAAAPSLPDYPDTTETPEIAVGAKEPPISTEEHDTALRILKRLHAEHVARLVEGGFSGKSALVHRKTYWKELHKAGIPTDTVIELLEQGRVRTQSDGLYWIPVEVTP